MKFQHSYREIHFFMKIFGWKLKFSALFWPKKAGFRSYLSHFGLKLTTIFQLRYSIFFFQKIRYKFRILSYRATPGNHSVPPQYDIFVLLSLRLTCHGTSPLAVISYHRVLQWALRLTKKSYRLNSIQKTLFGWCRLCPSMIKSQHLTGKS